MRTGVSCATDSSKPDEEQSLLLDKAVNDLAISATWWRRTAQKALIASVSLVVVASMILFRGAHKFLDAAVLQRIDFFSWQMPTVNGSEPLEFQFLDLFNDADKGKNKSQFGWELVFISVLADDKTWLYQRNGECAMVFEGATIHDWPGYFRTAPSDDMQGCGIKGLYTAWIGEFEPFLQSASWKNEWFPYLTSKCPNGVYSTGVSRGGALASVFAACASNLADGASFMLRDNPVPMGMNIKGLYVIASPALSTTQMVNGRSKDGVFSGSRIFFDDPLTVDLVSIATQRFVKNDKGHTYLHPKVEAVNLRDPLNFGFQNDMERIEYSACADDTGFQPHNVWWKFGELIGHHHSFYIKRWLMTAQTGKVLKAPQESCQ